jgi:hypothetical protein
MADPKPFAPVKLVCGVLCPAGSRVREEAEGRLEALYGSVDLRGPVVPFSTTAYYDAEMGPGLERGFLSFAKLVRPEDLPDIKLETNALEEELRRASGAALRAANLDPGYVTSAALIMATAKDFAHRVPLRDGIYAHLELLFTKSGPRTLDWTYPDLRGDGHREFLLGVRARYLEQRP